MVKIKRQTIPSVDDNVEWLPYIAIGNLGKQLISIIYVNTHYIIQYFHSCEIRVITTYVQKPFTWKFPAALLIINLNWKHLVDGQMAVYPYNGIILANKEKATYFYKLFWWISETLCWVKKSDIKECILYDSIVEGSSTMARRTNL